MFKTSTPFATRVRPALVWRTEKIEKIVPDSLQEPREGAPKIPVNNEVENIVVWEVRKITAERGKTSDNEVEYSLQRAA